MATLRFPESVGSLGDDDIRIGSNELAFGLSSNDLMSATYGSEYAFMAGGAGDDGYVAADWSAITIIDSGGYDRVYTDGIGVYRGSTYAATVEGRHLIVADTYSGQQVAIANWQSPGFRIEEVVLADGVYSYQQVRQAVFSSPNYLGDFSVSQLANEGVLPWGTSSADLAEFIDYTLAREQALTQSQLDEAQAQREAEAQETVQAMFVAYYARPADPAGMTYWKEQLLAAKGDPAAISQAFGDSAEFLAVYGGLSDSELISRLYQQLFSRAPDVQGLAFYLDQLQSGAMSPADIAMGIARGAQGMDAELWETKLQAADALTQALEDDALLLNAYRGDLQAVKAFMSDLEPGQVISEPAIEALVESMIAEAATQYHPAIQELFVAYYGRPADPAGQAFWAKHALASDGKLSSIVEAFGNSEEYIQTLGGLSAADQVEVIFEQLFGREPDAEGRAFYVGHLEAGNLGLADIALSVAQGAQGEDAAVLAARVAYAEGYTAALTSPEELDAFASPLGQATVKHALARIRSSQDADEELAFLGHGDVLLDLDALTDLEEESALVDAGTGSMVLIDSAAYASQVDIVNFSDDDVLRLIGVTEDDIMLTVTGYGTRLELDNASGVVSHVTLVGITGDHDSLAGLNALGMGEVVIG